MCVCVGGQCKFNYIYLNWIVKFPRRGHKLCMNLEYLYCTHVSKPRGWHCWTLYRYTSVLKVYSGL